MIYKSVSLWLFSSVDNAVCTELENTLNANLDQFITVLRDARYDVQLSPWLLLSQLLHHWQSVGQSVIQFVTYSMLASVSVFNAYGFRLQMSAVCAEIHEIHSSSSRHCLLVFTSSEFSRSQIVPAQQT